MKTDALQLISCNKINCCFVVLIGPKFRLLSVIENLNALYKSMIIYATESKMVFSHCMYYTSSCLLLN